MACGHCPALELFQALFLHPSLPPCLPRTSRSLGLQKPREGSREQWKGPRFQWQLWKWLQSGGHTIPTLSPQVPTIMERIRKNLDSIHTASARRCLDSLLLQLTNLMSREEVKNLLQFSPPSDRSAACHSTSTALHPTNVFQPHWASQGCSSPAVQGSPEPPCPQGTPAQSLPACPGWAPSAPQVTGAAGQPGSYGAGPGRGPAAEAAPLTEYSVLAALPWACGRWSWQCRRPWRRF